MGTTFFKHSNLFVFAAFVLVCLLMPDMAFAAGKEAGALFSKALCGIQGWFTGGVGVAIASIGVIVIGIGALMGKVSWGVAIMVAMGIVIIFGALEIVGAFGGKNTCA